MTHCRGGELRAYHDGMLDDRRAGQVRAHLETCPRCADLARHLQERNHRIEVWMGSTDPSLAAPPVEAARARHRFDEFARRRKDKVMLKNLFARRYRAAWTAVSVLVALAIAFSFAPVRALAGDLLGLFRVQRIQFLEINPAQLSDSESLEAAAQKLEGVLQDQVTFEMEGEPEIVDEATARSALSIRLPAALDGEPRIALRPAMSASMQIDLERIRLLLSELDYKGIELPDSIDGADVSIAFGQTAIAAYGACDPGASEWGETVGASDDAGGCTVFAQMPSPSVSAPSELDVDQLGQAYLQLLGLSAQEAAQFSERVDWATTLVVPVPSYASLSYADVKVDGVVGTLIRSPRGSNSRNEYLLTWVKNDIVYALHSVGTVSDAVRIAESLQ